jgi:subtilisin family serine protease
MRRLLLVAPFLISVSAWGQATIDLMIGGKEVHLTLRPQVVAIRIVLPSASISIKPAIANAFSVFKASAESAGLLGIGKASSPSGAMPSGTGIYKATNQVQQLYAYGVGSNPVNIVLSPELIVQFKPGVTDDVARQRLRTYGAQAAQATQVAGRYLVSMPQAQSVVLATNNMPKYVPEVLYAEPNFYFFHPSGAEPFKAVASPASSPSPSGTIGDPDLAYQWTLATTPIDFGVAHAWSALGTTGTNVKVAIVDDGVDLNHEDLKDAISDYWDTTTNPPSDTTTQPPYTLQPEAQHGTACAGIVAARINGVGIEGVAPNVKLIAIKAAVYLNNNGTTQWYNNTAWLADAIDKASALGADIISNSWGIPNGVQSQDISNAIDRALNGTNARRILLFAAGNLKQDDPSQSLVMDFPASLSSTKAGVISVAASTPCDVLKSFTSCDNDPSWASKYQPQPTILAPGTSIATTVPGNGYAYFSGTSASTPFMAGAIALLMSANPTLTRSQIIGRIQADSRTITDGSNSFLRIDAYCLVSGPAACGG